MSNKIDGYKNLVVDGIDHKDFPDFCDAFFSHAERDDGTILTDAELDALTDAYPEVVNTIAITRCIRNEDNMENIWYIRKYNQKTKEYEYYDTDDSSGGYPYWSHAAYLGKKFSTMPDLSIVGSCDYMLRDCKDDILEVVQVRLEVVAACDVGSLSEYVLTKKREELAREIATKQEELNKLTEQLSSVGAIEIEVGKKYRIKKDAKDICEKIWGQNLVDSWTEGMESFVGETVEVEQIHQWGDVRCRMCFSGHAFNFCRAALEEV